MIQHSVIRHSVTHSAVSLLALGALLGACSGDVVIMGENGDEDDSFVPPPHSRCVGDRTLAGDVEVKSQVELDALEGCTTIDGHLVIQPIFHPDLRPLHRLNAVRGELGLGATNTFSSLTWTEDEARLASVTVESGFVHSLEGLDRLETVGSLSLNELAVTSLEPLAQLRQLTHYGTLSITGCDAITDLGPLSQAAGIQRLIVITENLTSLDGLQIGDRLVSLALSGPQLADIDALSSLRVVDGDLGISDTALRDLAPLARLEQVGGLLLADNEALDTLHGLEALRTVNSRLRLTNNNALRETSALSELIMAEQLVVEGNDSLQKLADFTQLRVNTLHVTSNRAIEELPLLRGTYHALAENNPPELLLGDRGQIEVAANPALRRFAVPREWHDGVYVIIENNRTLRELDLGDLESLDLLEIKRNDLLDTFEVGALATVDTLEVVDNPVLSPTAFNSLQTFQRTMSGNGASAP